jgi:thymidylate synthase (FAD)
MTQITATYVDHMGDDLSVVNAARVSFGKKSELQCTDIVLGIYEMTKRDRGLINYLASHKHISPFGHCFASFHIKAPVFVARQLVKHKFLRWNEISRRYVDDVPEFYTPDVWRGRADDVKQGSGAECKSQYFPNIYADEINTKAVEDYKKMLQQGVAPEQARMILPQSAMTEWYWSGSLDAFADMCRLRCATDTQAETQKVAWDISLKMEDLFPVSWVALMDG